ncbi:MAG: Gfo/Idh/MocA family oxidoreductase [Clostridia bacterium]|nr:Gfo/Idh/MocA family oxidoreductase [Clostridia bacterium]
MDKKVRVGVLGGYRGASMINYCKRADNAEVVAICDNAPDVLDAQKEYAKGMDIAFYADYDEFLEHDMDAVVLANFATEHAPFAIKALKKGLHVFSEVSPMQTMKEAVELVETVEETGKIYAYGENYCYMLAPYEMRRLYKEGKLGEFEYGECGYVHNCAPIWHSITYGVREHWRNNMYSTYYCTHSLGPIIHATGLRPVSVTGFESTMNKRNVEKGAKGACMGIEMVTLENGGIIKSIHGGLYENSIWYSMYGSKGRMECAREDADAGHVDTLYVNCDDYEGEYKKDKLYSYKPDFGFGDKIEGFGHSGSDFISMWHFIEKIKGNPDADIIDIYEGLDMFLPGMFAYRSILAGGIPMEIPNLRNKEEREKWRNDTACTDKAVAGDQLLPTQKSGTPDIEDSVYEYVKGLWEDELNSDSKDTYRHAALTLGEKKEVKNDNVK